MKSVKKSATAVKSVQTKTASSTSAKSARTRTATGKGASAKTGPVKAGPVKAGAAKPVKAVKAMKSTNAEKKAVRPKASLAGGEEGTAKLLDSKVAYEGPLFRVLRDHLIEPDGLESYRDVIRHNGSVVILAVDPAKKDSAKKDPGKKGSGKKKDKKDPWVVIERQYRHAAGQYLWELPAGKLDAGESPLEGAKRELAEETGYAAQEWSPLVEYFASPGFLGESMKIFLAEGLLAGEAHPEEDEKIDFRLVRLSELLELIDEGKIVDGKTLTTVLLYARRLGLKRKK